MVEAGPKRIVYLSCEPSTLARDLARFSESGRYTLSDVALVDMFPQTYHFETVVRLVRNT
jgi:23S rRNA (uracil1939-C5)-methyltransferase